MKNKIIHLIFMALLCLPLVAMAGVHPKKGKYEKSKHLKKEYTVNADALVKISNKYGNVDVLTWNENRVVIEVKITVSGNNEGKVFSKLNDIDVKFYGSSSEVSARTIIGKSSSGWFNNNSNVNFQIDYKVKMPVTNNVDLTNDYGTISLNELKGRAKINCDYGKIIIGSLFHEDNEINMDYTSDSTIDYINSGEINADYSKLSIEKAKDIDLSADYTNTSFEYIENLNFDCDYGKVEVENGNVIQGDGDYLTMRFGTIYKKLRIETDYGGIKVKKVMKGFEKIYIRSDYTGVKIGIDSEAAFKFVIKTSYGGFSYDEDHVNFLKKIVKSNSKYYEGYVNDENSDAMIDIDTEYGSIKWENF